MVTVGAVTFYLRGQTCTFSADSVRAYVFQQLLCITYALTPHGSKVMIHGDISPHYQRYGEKILLGSDLNVSYSITVLWAGFLDFIPARPSGSG